MKLGEGDRCLPELEPWREMLDVGLSTFAEIPDAEAGARTRTTTSCARFTRTLQPGEQTFRVE